MVPACLRGPADRRGGVRYRLDGGFPRRGCVLGWGAKPHLTSSSFRAFRFATRCLGGCGGLCWRADEGVRPYTELEAFVTLARADTQVGPYKMHKADGISVGADAFIGSRAGQPAEAKREAIPCDNHPDPLRTIRHGTAVSTSQKAQACPKARPNRSRHRSADPRRAEGHCTGARLSGLFFWTVHGPFSFRPRPKRKWGVHPRWTSPLREQTPPWPPRRRPIPPPPAAGASAHPSPPPGGPPLPPPPAGKFFLNSQILHRYPLYKRNALRYDNSVSTRRI